MATHDWAKQVAAAHIEADKKVRPESLSQPEPLPQPGRDVPLPEGGPFPTLDPAKSTIRKIWEAVFATGKETLAEAFRPLIPESVIGHLPGPIQYPAEIARQFTSPGALLTIGTGAAAAPLVGARGSAAALGAEAALFGGGEAAAIGARQLGAPTWAQVGAGLLGAGGAFGALRAGQRFGPTAVKEALQPPVPITRGVIQGGANGGPAAALPRDTVQLPEGGAFTRFVERHRPTLKGAARELPPTSPKTIMGELHNFDEAVEIITRPDYWRAFSNAPGVRTVMRELNLSAVANEPVDLYRVGRALLHEESNQLSQGVIAQLNQFGTVQQVFGAVDNAGLLIEGPFKGLTVNTLRTYPKRYNKLFTVEQRRWINNADFLEEAKLKYLRANGVEVNVLVFEEGGRYAGRLVYGKVSATGELIDTVYVGAGPGRPGARLPSQKVRVFETAEDAIKEGYRYLPEDEALYLNIVGAHKRVADQRAADWLISKVPHRTIAINPSILSSVAEATRRKDYLAEALKIARRAKRGESLSGATISQVIRGDVELGAEFSRALSIKPTELNTVLGRLTKELGTQLNIDVKQFREVLGEVRTIKRGYASRPSQEYPTGIGPVSPGELTATLRQLTKSNKVSERMLNKIYLQARTLKMVERNNAFDIFIDSVQKRTPDARMKKNAAIASKTVAREKAERKAFLEESIHAPAFAGKYFTGIDAKETARILNESMDTRFSNALAQVNKANAVARYFMLAGDISIASIQLLFLAGANPKVYGKALASIPRTYNDTLFHAQYLARPENLAIIQKYPTLIISRGGVTEYTEALGRGGFLRNEPYKVAGESAVKAVAKAPVRTAVKVLQPFQRIFETTMDVAGFEMIKSLDHMATTTAKQLDLAQFVNEFRGLTSSARLGVSATTRQLETAALLAPRYNRAIAALLFDTTRGGLRGQLARDHLIKGVLAITAMGVAISYALGEDEEQIVEHLNPSSSKFFTWQIAGQNVGPGTKVRSVIKLIANTTRDPEALTDTSIGQGPGSWVKNPLIKFMRGNTAPVASLAWDVLTGKDYIGDPTVQNPLIAAKTVSKRVMPIWIQTVAFEGGNLGEIGVRGISEFAGLRAYPVNTLWDLSAKWKSDFSKYYDIATTTKARQEKGQRQSRVQYRKRNPEVDAKLFLVGAVDTLRTSPARFYTIQLIKENPGILEDAEPEQMEVYEKVLGVRLFQQLRNEPKIQPEQVPTPTPAPTPTPVSIPTPVLSPTVQRWRNVSNKLDVTLLRALVKVWEGGKLASTEEQGLRRVFEQEPLGQTNFNTWLKQTLRQVQMNAAVEEANKLVPVGR
jgi:hypothetical protein